MVFRSVFYRVWLSLLVLGLWCVQARADFLPPEQAFKVSVNVQSDRCVSDCLLDVRVEVAPAYYLYRERFGLEAADGQSSLEFVSLPSGLRKYDAFLKQEVEALRGVLNFQVRYSLPEHAQGLGGVLVLQGCADAGLCYPPMRVPLSGANGSLGDLFSKSNALAVPLPVVPDEAGGLATRLAGQSAVFVLPVFFGLGLLLAFTPCTLPMLPIVSGLVLGRRSAGEGRLRPMVLALLYVLGMALTYALMGVLAGLSGQSLVLLMQKPWVLWLLGGVIALLGLALLRGFSLQLPSGLQSWIHQRTGGLPGGQFVPVLVMGVLSGLLLGPCVAPPLAGALLYIGQTGDAVLGGLALFVLALGMGLPLVLFVAGAGAVLPTAGRWMQRVSSGFGLMLLALAVWTITPVTAVPVLMGLWAFFGAVCAWALWLVSRNRHGLPTLAHVVVRLLAVLSAACSLVYGVGLFSGASSVLNPLSVWLGEREEPSVVFKRVSSAEVLAVLRDSKRPVMLDFYADWCVSCKEFELFTLSDQGVQQRLLGIDLLQVDVTAGTPVDQQLLAQFKLFGPPAILFFPAASDSEVYRVIGFEDAAKFAASLDGVRSILAF